jgi:S-adenosylmethionine:tRNA ribosyltransferase-isomerase
MSLRRSDFNYALPPELIAQHPPRERTAARMLCLDPDGALRDAHITGLPGELRRGDLLVLNDTRVIPARLFGIKDSGGRVEVLVERVLPGNEVLAQIRASKSPRPGARIRIVHSSGEFEVLGRESEFFRLRLAEAGDVDALLRQAGHMPLPPYIQRQDEVQDRERYQTVFARAPGAVAAPTAGLHFDEALLAAIRARGVDTGFLTLHVGAGTFQPLRVEDLSKHRMHPERYEIPAVLAEAVGKTKARGGRVVAVGTTVVRALESAAAGGALRPGEGETRLFITPGFEFRMVDALLTNFHLPESTLLMLVCAFAGKERVLAAYRHAVAQNYRFFSYGDAMFIPRTAAP